MNYDTMEIPKHKKKVNKTVKKSKHKHTYVDCLIYHIKDNHRYYFKSTYCSICGKIGDKTMETEKIEGSSYSKILSNDELIKKYDNIEHIEVEDIYNVKYVPIKPI